MRCGPVRGVEGRTFGGRAPLQAQGTQGGTGRAQHAGGWGAAADAGGAPAPARCACWIGAGRTCGAKLQRCALWGLLQPAVLQHERPRGPGRWPHLQRAADGQHGQRRRRPQRVAQVLGQHVRGREQTHDEGADGVGRQVVRERADRRRDAGHPLVLAALARATKQVVELYAKEHAYLAPRRKVQQRVQLIRGRQPTGPRRRGPGRHPGASLDLSRAAWGAGWSLDGGPKTAAVCTPLALLSRRCGAGTGDNAAFARSTRAAGCVVMQDSTPPCKRGALHHCSAAVVSRTAQLGVWPHMCPCARKRMPEDQAELECGPASTSMPAPDAGGRRRTRCTLCPSPPRGTVSSCFKAFRSCVLGWFSTGN
jgi:hypothetical protein